MLLVLATAGCPSLQGTVRDAETGEPVAGAEVGVYVFAFAAFCGEISGLKVGYLQGPAIHGLSRSLSRALSTSPMAA